MPARSIGSRAVVVAVLALAAGAAVSSPSSALAGGGPETTVVVVNASSPTSWRVANEYVRLRKIPATHVCALGGVPSLGIVSVETFRTQLWEPVRAFLEKSGFADEVDVIAWSADFPYAVDYEAERPADKPVMEPGPDGKPRNSMWWPMASLSSMTYLARGVEKKDADAYLSPIANGYYRRATAEEAARELTAEEAAIRNEAVGAMAEKRWAEAVKAYDRLLASYEDVETLYNLGCALARVGSAAPAMRALERAVAAGYADAAHAADDADLESLRGRDDWKPLLARMRTSGTGGVQPSRGFRARYAWTGAAAPLEVPAADAPGRYRLSTLLAYTGEWGNSTPEALASLASAAQSDGTNPDGTFYFLENGDVRAKTRMGRFGAAVEALHAMGKKAEILTAGEGGQDGVVPQGKSDVMGAMLGVADFRWAAGKSRMLPGAIAEHLTSCGGEFCHGGQTKLCELIRNGAAGASGVVHEPYALEWKFPVPHLHVHYAAGCSLAEAFYQSVSGPYQLLIVGDPLARPFAHFASVTLEPWRCPVSGTVTVAPEVKAAEGRTLRDVELWVDGRLVGHALPAASSTLDTTTLEDGAHEVRVVAVEAAPIETRTFASQALTVANGKVATTIAAGKATLPLDASFALSGHAPGAKGVNVLAGDRVLATVAPLGETWRADVPATALGIGETNVQARAVRADGSAFRGPFLTLRVEPPTLRKNVRPLAATQDGLRGEWMGKDAKPIGSFVLGSLGGFGQPSVREAVEAAAKSVKGAWKEVRFEGEFDVGAEAGLYQFDVNAVGEIAIDVDGKPLLAPTRAAAERQVYAMAQLEKGWHSLVLRYAPSGAPDLTVLLGGERVTAPLSGKGIRHAAGK